MKKENTITVLLADDHAIIRAGIRRLLDDAPDMTVVAEVDSGEMAYREHMLLHPDVTIMDLTMPGIGGLEAIRRIRSKDEKARILVLSVHQDVIFPTRVIQAGGIGYLSKRTAPEALLSAVRCVAKGEVFLERDIAQKIALHGIAGEEDPVKELSEREFEVFRMLAEGKSVNEVADALFLSSKTVGTYQTRILQKLNVNNIAGLAHLAIRKGIIEP
ncbi:MAG: response regulator [Gammaproteobacteria bacterium]|nr:response regulator [Gammaproteobacteria bacterium]